MAVVKMSEWANTFEADYNEFLASDKNLPHDKRYRPDGETIFDALCSEEANFSLDDKDGQILDVLQKIQ